MPKHSARYLTQDEIDAIEVAIYNNLPVPITYTLRGDNREKYKSTSFEKSLLKGEKWSWLPHPELTRFAITSKGRLFNGTTQKQLKLFFNKDTIFFQYVPYYIDLGEMFEKLGWEFDVEIVLNTYIENNWRYTTSKNFRKTYLERV